MTVAKVIDALELAIAETDLTAPRPASPGIRSY